MLSSQLCFFFAKELPSSTAPIMASSSTESPPLNGGGPPTPPLYVCIKSISTVGTNIDALSTRDQAVLISSLLVRLEMFHLERTPNNQEITKAHNSLSLSSFPSCTIPCKGILHSCCSRSRYTCKGYVVS